VTGRRLLPPAPFLISLLAIAMFGCGVPGRSAAPTSVGQTLPPVPTTKAVDGDAVIEKFKAALGPDSPVRLQGSANARVGDARFKILTDGDFQGSEMDARVSIQVGALQLSFDVIAANGKTYVRPNGGKWARSPEKPPPAGSGPFGDMSKAKLRFAGKAKLDPGLYTIVWDDPTNATRSDLNGTVLTDVRITSSVMTFDVNSSGVPYTATYTVKGTGKFEGRKETVSVTGTYRFFRIHDPLEFKAPIK
jgi:hypothetical protein